RPGRAAVLAAAHEPDRRSQLGERLAAGLPDGEQRFACLLGPPVHHVDGRSRLHVDARDAVGDHVVQVAGDAQPFVGDRASRLLVARLFQSPGPLLEAGEVGAPSAQTVAEEPRRRRPADGQQRPRRKVATGREMRGQQHAEGNDGHDEGSAALGGDGHGEHEDEEHQVNGPARVLPGAVHPHEPGHDREAHDRRPPPEHERGTGAGDEEIAEEVRRALPVTVWDLGRDEHHRHRDRECDEPVEDPRATEPVDGKHRIHGTARHHGWHPPGGVEFDYVGGRTLAGVRRIPDPERRARLATRHPLAPSARAADGVAPADRMAGLHSTDPGTVFLAAAARLRGPSVDAVERALYDDRTLVRTLCMRRTLFVVPVGLVPIVQAAVTDALVPTERTRTVRMIEEAGIARDGARWLRRAETDTLAAIEALGETTGAGLAKAVPRLRRQIPYGEGKTWAGKMGMTTRVLFLLACEQRVVRGRPQGAWTSTRYRWAPMRSWLPEGFAAWKPDEARAELARRWLAAFGPGTVA